MADYDTVIVGMGAAGATAAATLAEAGVRVLALEAMDRVGGRVYSTPLGDGVVELGAEWIHGTSKSRTYELATKHKVGLINQAVFFEVMSSNGAKGDSALVNKLSAHAMMALEKQTDESAGEIVTRILTAIIREEHPEIYKDKDQVTELLNFQDLRFRNWSSAPSWYDLTLKTDYRDLEGHQHVSWGRNGYKTLFDILLNKYNNGSGLPSLTVKLNSEVTNIDYSAAPVTVTTADGARYTANNVIVTVSLGVLKARHKELFSPKLPEPKTTAIDKISIGVMDKVIFLFERPWWPETKAAFFAFLWRSEDRKQLSDEDEWLTKVFAASKPVGCEHALTLWTSGEVGKMVETMPEEVVKIKLLGLIRRFMGKDVDVPEPIAMARSTWFHNPFTAGSYSYDSLDTAQHPTARTDLASPITDTAGHPRVLFAGEATDPHYYSTVHGATDSGHREATRILQWRDKVKIET